MQADPAGGGSGGGSGGGGAGASGAPAAAGQGQPADLPGGGGSSSSSRGTITLVASTRRPQSPGRPAAFLLRVPRLDAYFTGTGDLLAALLLAWTERHPGDLAAAVEKAVAGLQGVLAVTAAAAAAEAGGAGGATLLSSRERTAAAFRAKELRLVQAQGALLSPVVTLRAEPLAC